VEEGKFKGSVEDSRYKFKKHKFISRYDYLSEVLRNPASRGSGGSKETLQDYLHRCAADELSCKKLRYLLLQCQVGYDMHNFLRGLFIYLGGQKPPTQDQLIAEYWEMNHNLMNGYPNPFMQPHQRYPVVERWGHIIGYDWEEIGDDHDRRYEEARRNYRRKMVLGFVLTPYVLLTIGAVVTTAVEVTNKVAIPFLGDVINAAWQAFF